MSKRLVARLLSLTVASTLMLALAPAVFADGEIGDVGDTDSIGNIYDASTNHATLKVDYVHDCPAGVSGCDIQVRFRYKCPEFWCLDWSYQSWKSVGAPVSGIGTVAADCTGAGNDDNYWEAEYRIRWWATATVTETLTGEMEAYITASGSIAYRLIGEASATAGIGGMVKGSVTIETVTATSRTWTTGVVATSQGTVLNTCQ